MNTYYNQISAGYEELHREEQRKKLILVKDWLARHRPIKKSDLLLDVACGTGLTSDFPCIVVGLDPAMQLLQRNPNQMKVLGEAEHLPFADNTFDIVSSITALQNFHDPEQASKEMKRVGKKNCLFIISFLRKTQHALKFEAMMKTKFTVTEMVMEEKDCIYFCR